MSDRRSCWESEENRVARLDRRDLLKVAGAGAGAVLAGGACAAGGAGSSPGGESPGRPEDPALSARTFELSEVGIAELQSSMADGSRSSESVTRAYLERIAAHDRSGVALHAVIETNPDALEIARQLDEERAGGTVRSSLHGVPILLKDNIATADRNTTTAGSLALEGSIPSQDAFVAARLRAAGAVLLGKANLSEWANFRSSDSSSGWSGRGGQCRNPYALDRNPCGSSSGSGAAASASFCAAAIGTETNGSIVCPSSANGLVGIKPTVGLVSRSGIVPISASQDTAGPMARTVADAAAVLGALTGEDPRDPATAGQQARSDYSQFVRADGLEGKRIGVLRSTFGFHPQVDELLEQALVDLAAAGAELVDPVEMPSLRQAGRDGYTVLLYEFKDGLNRYLAGLGDAAPVKTLADVIAFNEAHAERELAWFGQDILELSESKGDLGEQEYRDALANVRRATRDDGIDRVLTEHRLDAIFAPTGGPAWLIDLINGDSFGGGSSSPAAISGYANITVPGGFVHGLPCGVSFFAGAWSEATLIEIAAGYEATTGHRQAPQFHATLPL